MITFRSFRNATFIADINAPGSRIQALGYDRQVPCSATDFEDSLARNDGCLVDELPVERLYSQKLGESIIEGKEPVFSRCRDIGFPGRSNRGFSPLYR